MTNRIISFSEATREAMIQEMRKDSDVFVFGEDIVKQGGMFGQFSNLSSLFPNRVKDTPISETALVGAGVGAAIAGSKPVIDLHFADFIGITMDEILNQMAKARYMFGGQATVPLVLRAPDGSMKHGAAQHSQSLESWFMGIPGIRVVIPSTPENGKGLLQAAIQDPNPVIYFENKGLFPLTGHVPEGDVYTPLDKAEIVRKGQSVTLVSYSLFLSRALAAAEHVFEKYGIDVEVIDLRSIVPIDTETIYNSVKKTGKLIIAHEAIKIGGVGSEIAARVTENVWEYLEAPILRVGAKFSPVPFSPPMEAYIHTNENEIVEAILAITEKYNLAKG